jgi:hypothetical protein
MTLITNATSAWSDPAITLTRDEFWQARSGGFIFSTSASPAANEGIVVPASPFGIELRAGVTVRYRRALNDQACVISRMPVAL